MADEVKGKEGEENRKASQADITINAQYLRDLSFESPNAPQSMAWMQNQQPNIAVDMNVRHRQLENKIHETVLTIRADAKIDDKQLFLVECSYAAVVTLGSQVPDETANAILVVEISRLIFPFARKIVAEAVQEGGFPPLLVNPLDFSQLLQNNSKSTPGGEQQKPN